MTENVAEGGAAEAGGKRQPSILFASPMNLLDITSGAALSMRTLMAALVGRGFRAVALGATLFDSAFGGEHVVKAANEQHKDKQVLRAEVLGVEHLIVRTAQPVRIRMTSEEEERYIQLLRKEIKTRRPDMIITWGGLLLEMAVMREAQEAGIPVVFYLVSANYKDLGTFRYVTSIVSDTNATADVYKERFGFHCNVIGKFIDESLIKAPRRNPEFITFINPSFEKGVNVFMPMARMAAKECPEVKFLVVQSRGRWDIALKAFGYSMSEFPNVKIIGHQKDMRPVYGSTKALLLPSTWHESGARVIVESLLNSIPIVASHTGGSPELVGKGGKILTLPEDVRANMTKPADEATARQWLDEVKRIWSDEGYYNGLAAAAGEEARKHGINASVDRFIAAISAPVLESLARHDARPVPADAYAPQSPYLRAPPEVVRAKAAPAPAGSALHPADMRQRALLSKKSRGGKKARRR